MQATASIPNRKPRGRPTITGDRPQPSGGWAAGFVVVPLLYGLAPGQSLTAAMVSGPIVALLAAAALVVGAGRFGSRRVAGS